MIQTGLWFYIFSKGLGFSCLSANYWLFFSFPTNVKYHIDNISNSNIHTHLSPNSVFSPLIYMCILASIRITLSYHCITVVCCDVWYDTSTIVHHFFFLNWRITALKCCVGFCCIISLFKLFLSLFFLLHKFYKWVKFHWKNLWLKWICTECIR